MVQCDPGFVERTFAAADPSCRCFRWSQLRPEQRAPAAAAASLALWWSADARLSLDGAIQAVWTALEGLVPSQRHSWRLADRDVLRAAWELDEDVGSASANAVQAWWQERQDAAYGALLRVEKAKLEGVALTSQTGRTLRLRPPKFRLLTEVSPDGVRFPETLEASRLPGRATLPSAGATLWPHGVCPWTSSTPWPQSAQKTPRTTQTSSRVCGAALPRPPESPVAGASPTYHEMELAIQKGSTVTCLDGLPAPRICPAGLCTAAPGGHLARPGVRDT